MIRAAIETSDTEGVWVPLGQLGQLLNAADPSFDARNYGCPNLSTLAKKAGTFEVREIDNVLKIRIKPNERKTGP
ncbi:MAG: OST-HTH/LOTUS domain-containing protein [Paracoccaceae bacterium]